MSDEKKRSETRTVQVLGTIERGIHTRLRFELCEAGAGLFVSVSTWDRVGPRWIRNREAGRLRLRPYELDRVVAAFRLGQEKIEELQGAQS